MRMAWDSGKNTIGNTIIRRERSTKGAAERGRPRRWPSGEGEKWSFFFFFFWSPLLFSYFRCIFFSLRNNGLVAAAVAGAGNNDSTPFAYVHCRYLHAYLHAYIPTYVPRCLLTRYMRRYMAVSYPPPWLASFAPEREKEKKKRKKRYDLRMRLYQPK
jgi:hypothetical protein